MVIDFHTHIFPDAIAEKTIAILEKASGIKADTDGTLNGLLQSMEVTGVDMSVILPVVTKPSQFESVNVFAKQINEKYAGKCCLLAEYIRIVKTIKQNLEPLKKWDYQVSNYIRIIRVL